MGWVEDLILKVWKPKTGKLPEYIFLTHKYAGDVLDKYGRIKDKAEFAAMCRKQGLPEEFDTPVNDATTMKMWTYSTIPGIRPWLRKMNSYNVHTSTHIPDESMFMPTAKVGKYLKWDITEYRKVTFHFYLFGGMKQELGEQKYYMAFKADLDHPMSTEPLYYRVDRYHFGLVDNLPDMLRMLDWMESPFSVAKGLVSIKSFDRDFNAIALRDNDYYKAFNMAIKDLYDKGTIECDRKAEDMEWYRDKYARSVSLPFTDPYGFYSDAHDLHRWNHGVTDVYNTAKPKHGMKEIIPYLKEIRKQKGLKDTWEHRFEYGEY